MLKRNSSLDSIYLPGSYPNKNDITLTFKEDKSLFLKQLACWPNTLFETENFIKQELGLNNVPDFNKGFVNEEISIWRIEPFKW